jgi:formate-nitrite transporter family protein
MTRDYSSEVHPMPMPKAKQTDEEAAEKSSPTAHVVYEAIRMEGRHELERQPSSLAWSGLAAGLSMGFSFVAQAVLEYHLPDTGWRPLLANFGYSIGFLMVILGRQQLFTENTLTVILPLLQQKTGRDLLKVARLWSVVLATNLLGGLIFAWVLAKSSAFEPDVQSAFGALAGGVGEHPFGVMVLRGVYAGWLIALMVWLLPAAESARIWIIIIVTYMVGICHFPHVIAGATEVFYLAFTGGRAWSDVFAGFLAPTFIGNTLGGVTLVAALAYAQIKGDQKQAGR